MADPVSTTISVVAMAVSAVTAWANILRRGRVRMTRPGFVAFKYDHTDDGPLAKIYIRGLLYSTGKRGHVVENMFVVLRREGTQETFNIWGHGPGDGKLVRGGGLFVPETGAIMEHHFNPAYGSAPFRFLPGNYKLQIFATLPNSKPICLYTLEVTTPEFTDFSSAQKAIWFDWHPDTGSYRATVRQY